MSTKLNNGNSSTKKTGVIKSKKYLACLEIKRSVTKNRDFYQNLFDKSTHGICITDLDRNVVMVNPEMKNLTGYDAEEMIGRPITEIYCKDDGTSLDVEAVKRGEVLTVSTYLKKKRKGDVPVKIRYVLIDGPKGNGLIMETYSDLSDRLKFDRLKNEFVFIAAHELRNPVTAIKLLLDIIFDDKRVSLNSILRDYLLKVQEANERLTHLVDDLLEVSRTESNRLKIHVTKQNIVEHINQILENVRPTAVSKGLTVKYSQTGKMPMVMADAMKLKEILSNLISNSVKYNVTGGKVVISHEISDGQLHTSIRDTGIGISAEDQKNLFQKFWRSEDMAVRAQAGTGLGLFIVRELVNRMGGDISVKSRHGHGSTITFSLPLSK